MRSILSTQLHALAWAVSFLTRVPVPSVLFKKQANTLTHVPFYLPWVGLILAAPLLVVSFIGLEILPLPLLAGVLLAVWVLLTGALHLDGLADSFDALAARHKPAVDIHAVLKDPACGALGVVSITLVLLLKVLALYYLLDFYHPGILVLPLVFARYSAQCFMALTPCAKNRGFAAMLTRQGAKSIQAQLGLVVNGVALALVSFWVLGLWCATLFALVALWSWYWRWIWVRAIKGYVGDTMGALIEVSELLVMVGLVCLAAYV